MSKNILTAIDIDTSKKSIENQIEENVKNFNKSRLRKEVKRIKDELKLEYPDNPEKQIIPKEIIENKLKEFYADSETEEFRKFQKHSIETQKDNYLVLRKTIQDLNDLNEFSAEIERNELQTINKFKHYEPLLNFSLSKLSLFHKIIQTRKTNITKFINKLNSDNLISDPLQELILLRDYYKTDNKIDDIDLFEKFNLESNIEVSNKLGLYYLNQFKNGNISNNILNDLLKRDSIVAKLNSKQLINNKLLGLLLLNNDASTDINSDLVDSNFITNNAITCLETAFTNNINNERVYKTRTLGELLFEITNDEYANTQKTSRQQIYYTYDGTRPTVNEYYKWNGLQVFDIDLKGWNGNIENLKQHMFNYLEEFNWFLWICKSASGNGIHIYTKVTPPHHVYTNINDNEYISKYWYNANYITKSANIYDILYRIHNDTRNDIVFPDNYFNPESNKFELSNKVDINGENKTIGLDNIVGRITSGIRLTYDQTPLINHNFIDLQIGLNLCQTIDGFDYQKAIQKVLLRDTPHNKKLIEQFNELAIDDLNTFKAPQNQEIDLSKFVTLGADIADLKPLPRNMINYQLRYNVCNTLAALFGKDGLPIAHTLLDSTNCRNVGEINSFYSCAISNKKQPSKYGLDILKKNGIIKSVEPELKEISNNTFKNGIKKAIENSLNNKLGKSHIELSESEYLSDKKHILLDSKAGGIINSKINIIFSPPGSGKTEFIKTLAKDGKRILLVLPYISVIRNKIETDQEIMSMFECYYGTKDIKQIEYGINAVTTFDKFSRSNYEKIARMFDFIFVDESHLLFTSSYRIEATSNVIKKIKELFYISSNDPFAARLCLLTGTETGESYFFGQVANIIQINKHSLNKDMEFLICDDVLDATTRLADSAYKLLQEGYKLLIPTNKGEIYSEKIIGMVEHLLGRNLKYGYYKRSNTEQEICRLINDQNTVGDYEIVFCSNYLSVGVDINDGGKNKSNVKFASLYLGPFSGYEIEQFNARVRKTGIKSIYCIRTQKSDGSTNDILLEEPNLLLRITEEDKENFIDDKSIAGAKQEFITQYDPVLHKIITPGFSYLNGKIRFNLEEYELLSFENKYNECMQHPVKVARELDKYGYKIKVSLDYDGLDLTKQEELKSIGIKAAKDEKIRKHTLLVGTFIDLVKKNSYVNEHGLEFTDIIGWIGKNSDKIFEDRTQEDFVKIEFDVFATPLFVSVKSKEALDSMYKPAKYLISKYSITKILDIINQYVDDSGILKQKNFKRAINLLKLIDSSDANELTEPLTKMLEKIYDFVDQFEMSKDSRISYNTYQSTIESWTNEYIDTLGIKINTTYGFEKIKDSIHELLADVATKSTSKNGIRFTYNKLPDQDSNTVLNRRSVDSMIEKMFRLTSDAILTNKSRKKHVILIEQTF